MSLPYFNFYPRDWLSDTRITMGMSLAEEGAYCRLLALMWTDKSGTCSVRDDDQWIARGLRVSLEEWKSVRAVLVDGDDPVVTTLEGRLTNKRLLEEWGRATDKSAKASRASRSRQASSAPSDDGSSAPSDDGSSAPSDDGSTHQIPDPRSQNGIKNPLTPRCGGDGAVAASEGPGASRPRPPGGGAKDAAGERPAKRSHPGLADPDCRSIANAGFEALKAAGVSNLPQDWWRRAAISAHGTIRRGTAPPTAAEVRSAIAWSMDPERWQYKRGDLLHRRFGLLLADYQAASADVVPENRRAPAPAAPVVDHAARLVALALEGLGPDGRPLEPEPQPAGPFVLPPWSKRAKAAETGSRGP